MRKTNYLRGTTIIALVFLLQSCVKNGLHLPGNFRDDKLLLSKITGSSNFTWDRFEFDKNNNFNLFDTFFYGKEQIGFENIKPLQHVGFYSGGTWDFVYPHFFPEQVIDHSVPGVDQGYWQFYYNPKGQIEKTGLAFSTSAGPSQFEYYQYDDRGNLTSLLYGTAPDTPFFKFTYQYDERNNLVQFEFLFPNGYANSTSSTAIFKNMLKKHPENPIANSLLSKLQKLEQRNDQATSLSINKPNNNSATTLSINESPDSNVIYELYLTAKITTDGRINPYQQQANLLFYVQDRNYNNFNPDSWYIDLLKSNPLNVEWILNPDFGSDTATSTFNYTYNQLGYPLTTHQELDDPTEGVFGFGLPIIQNYQIAYIKNN